MILTPIRDVYKRQGFSHVCKDGPVFDASEVIFE